MQVFWIIFQQEILLSFRHLGKILANFLFFLISISVFSLTSEDQIIQGFTPIHSITIIWISLLFCSISSAAEFLKKDFDDGAIEQALVSCENFEIFVLAKMLANWLACCLPILIFIPLILLANHANQSLIANSTILIFLASLIINFICTFCGSLSVLGSAAPIIAVIAMPLIIPIILVAYAGLLGENFQTSFRILLGLSVFIGSISVFASAKIIKIAAD